MAERRALSQMRGMGPHKMWLPVYEARRHPRGGEEVGMDQYDREEAALFRDFEEGRITQKELNKALRDLERDYREAAGESARRAYDQEMERW